MAESERPSFLGQYWLLPMRGFSYESQPPRDLASDAHLESPSQWLRLLSVLERAKAGDFSELGRLPNIISSSDDEQAIECGLRLMAHAGSKSLRKGLSRFFSHPNPITRSAALDAARFTCDLALVEPLLEFLRSAGDSDRLLVMSVLSGLLEAEPATLYDDADTIAPDAYEKLVQQRAGSLRKRFGDTAAILNGKLLDFWHVLDRIESLCRDENAFSLSGLISIYINYFEAMTGARCVGLFDGELAAQTSAILAAVERFRYNSRPEDFLPGQRYFFGHPVSD